MVDDSLADRSRAWYEAHARRYDRRHPGLPGDLAFYAGLAAGRRVLEIGAGTGRVTKAMAVVARSVVAIDYAPAMLCRAAGRLAHVAAVRLVLADARALPLAGSFALIALPYRVIHHFVPDERRRLWRSLTHLLADDGLIAFDSWHGPTSGERAGRGAPPAASIDRAEIPAELSAVGLTVRGMGTAFSAMGTEQSFLGVWIAQPSGRASEHAHDLVDS